MKSLRTPQHLELLRLLIAARNDAGMTQQQLAKRLKRHQSFVAKYESGERRFEIIEFLQICRGIGAKPEKIIEKVS